MTTPKGPSYLDVNFTQKRKYPSIWNTKFQKEFSKNLRPNDSLRPLDDKLSETLTRAVHPQTQYSGPVSRPWSSESKSKQVNKI